MSGYWVYHWSGEEKSKIAATRDEYQQLLLTGEYFDNPTSAWEFNFLFHTELWTTRQACFLLSGQNPEPLDKAYSQEANFIYKLLDQDHLLGKIKLIEHINIRQDVKLMAKNIHFIDWANQRKLTIPETFLNFLKTFNLNLLPDQHKKNDKQPRTNVVRELIVSLYKDSLDKSPRSIWLRLKKLSEGENGHPVIHDVDNWGSSSAKIYWKSHRGKEPSMGRRRFENLISEIKKSHS